MGLDYYDLAVIETVPRVYAEMAAAFRQVYGCELQAGDLASVLLFGSWIGGDRGGNPSVKPACARDALEMARQLILSHYLRSVVELRNRLSQSVQQSAVSDNVEAALQQYAERIPEAELQGRQ